jgi:hypothetical protein
LLALTSGDLVTSQWLSFFVFVIWMPRRSKYYLGQTLMSGALVTVALFSGTFHFGIVHIWNLLTL